MLAIVLEERREEPWCCTNLTTVSGWQAIVQVCRIAIQEGLNDLEPSQDGRLSSQTKGETLVQVELLQIRLSIKPDDVLNQNVHSPEFADPRVSQAWETFIVIDPATARTRSHTD
jgi:hypothetical protein